MTHYLYSHFEILKLWVTHNTLCTCSTTITISLPINQFIAEQFLLISDTVQLKTASTLASVNDCTPWLSPSTPECLGPHMELLSGEPQERHPVQPAQFEIHSLWSQTYVKQKIIKSI